MSGTALVEALTAIRGLVREAAQLGAKFRLSGADVEIGGLAGLPSPLREELAHYAGNGVLWVYLGGEELDLPALELADQLGVEGVVVKTVAECRAAVRNLLRDLKDYSGVLGPDIETAPRPEHARHRWARLNDDGTLAAVQPSARNEQDKPGIDPYRSTIATLQLYAGGRRGFVFRHQALHLLLQSHWLRRRHLVVHGATFEWKFLLHHCQDYQPPPGRRMPFRCECSLQAAGIMAGVGFGGEARRLDRAAKYFFDLDVPKELATADWGAARLSPGQIAYAVSDAVLTWLLWSVLQDQLQSKRRWGAYELQRKAVPVVAAMELLGIFFDRAEHRRQIELWACDLAEAREEFVRLSGDPPPAKPNDVRDWLTRVLTASELADWQRSPKAGMLSIASDALERLAHIEAARPLLRILAKEKLLANFGPKLAARISPVTGRLYSSFNLAATKAGRFSASGPNFQQFPTDRRAAGFRKCVTAPPGYVIIGCDFNQVELRALAFLSKNAALTRVYANQEDLHRQTAARINRIPVDAVTEIQRNQAKAINFGCIYGLGARGLAAYAFNTYGVEMSVAEAQRYLDQFFATYPGLKDYLHEHYRLCRHRGYVVIGAGRVVEARWEKFGLSYQQCCNLPVQGVADDAMLRALVLVHARLRAAGLCAGIVSSIHDELLLEAHEDDAEEARAVLEATMTKAFALTFPGAPLAGVATARIGRTWWDTKQ